MARVQQLEERRKVETRRPASDDCDVERGVRLSSLAGAGSAVAFRWQSWAARRRTR
jgi:hypothetical protein